MSFIKQSISNAIDANRDAIDSIKEKSLRMRLRKELRAKGDFSSALTSAQQKEAAEYWGKYTKHFSPLWHEYFTAKNGRFDVRYIPEDILFTEIEPRINDARSDYGIDDKNLYKMYFPEIKHPYAVFRKIAGIYHDDDYNIISREKAIQNCVDCGDIILKPCKIRGLGGGINFWNKSDGVEKLTAMIDEMGDDINAQEIIKLHPALAKMNPSSCNRVRIMTYSNNEEIIDVFSMFSIGVGETARMEHGGVNTVIGPDGKLLKYGKDSSANIIEAHPNGIKFDGYTIPSYDKMLDVCKKMHRKMSSFRLISWDLTLDENADPVFIEMNLHWGGIMSYQTLVGPLFGDKTDKILDEIMSLPSRPIFYK